MTDIRCKKCNRLLMKVKSVIAEIKCPKCGYIQFVSKEPGRRALMGDIEYFVANK